MVNVLFIPWATDFVDFMMLPWVKSSPYLNDLTKTETLEKLQISGVSSC